MTLVDKPVFTDTVDQQHIIEALEGPKHPDSYLDRFPDELYNKAPESHLVRFLYSLVGPAGTGWLRKNTFEARLALEAQGLELFNLDDFYGNPLAFGRILEESYDQNVGGLLPNDAWQAIRTKDASYRARAIDFVNGARAGNSPFGMKLVSRSGLGREVEIIENYQYLFDSHNDDPIGLPHFGKTYLLNEFIVLPREETPRSEIQQVSIVGSPSAGTFILWFNGRNTTTLSFDADMFDIQTALEALPDIGEGGVSVFGGPVDFTVRFTGHLSATDTPLLTSDYSFTGGTSPHIEISTLTNGIPPLDETRHITARDAHNLQTALDRIKPVTAMPTTGGAVSRRQRQSWVSATASSVHNEVLRYVAGQPGVKWPVSSVLHPDYWIETNVEKEAPRIVGDAQFHYQGFHNVKSITSSSNHIGRFEGPQTKIAGYEYLKDNKDDTLVFGPDRALADYFEPLTVGTQTATSHLVNGIYPTDYIGLKGVPTVKYSEEQFWASGDHATGAETLTIDFGVVRALNYITMEVSRKPLGIKIEIDVSGQSTKHYVEVTPSGKFADTISFNPHQNPWEYVEYHFTDRLAEIPLTQFVRITFTRRLDESFLVNPVTGVHSPWTVEARNLRLGRNVVNY